MMGITAIVVTLPLIRYAVDNPDIISYRLATRMSGLERPIPGNPIVIFFDNLKNAMLMFGVSDGSTWLHSIPYRPALDVITAALFYLGMALLLYRYIRFRRWTDLFFVLSVPILMLPSILSIAFPEENPVLKSNRRGHHPRLSDHRRLPGWFARRHRKGCQGQGRQNRCIPDGSPHGLFLCQTKLRTYVQRLPQDLSGIGREYI